jgi:hypothetical protein
MQRPPFDWKFVLAGALQLLELALPYALILLCLVGVVVVAVSYGQPPYGWGPA